MYISILEALRVYMESSYLYHKNCIPCRILGLEFSTNLTCVSPACHGRTIAASLPFCWYEDSEVSTYIYIYIYITDVYTYILNIQYLDEGCWAVYVLTLAGVMNIPQTWLVIISYFLGSKVSKESVFKLNSIFKKVTFVTLRRLCPSNAFSSQQQSTWEALATKRPPHITQGLIWPPVSSPNPAPSLPSWTKLLFGTSFFSENGGSMAVVLATIYGWETLANAQRPHQNAGRILARRSDQPMVVWARGRKKRPRNRSDISPPKSSYFLKWVWVSISRSIWGSWNLANHQQKAGVVPELLGL